VLGCMGNRKKLVLSAVHHLLAWASRAHWDLGHWQACQARLDFRGIWLELEQSLAHLDQEFAVRRAHRRCKQPLARNHQQVSTRMLLLM